MKKLAIALALVLSSQASAKDIQNWTMLDEKTKGGYNASFTNSVNIPNYVFSYACNPASGNHWFTIIGISGAELPTNISSVRIQFDDKEIISAPVKIFDHEKWLYISETESFNQVIKNIRPSTSMKIELHLKNTTRYPIFSLMGASKAIMNTVSECEKSEGFTPTNEGFI